MIKTTVYIRIFFSLLCMMSAIRGSQEQYIGTVVEKLRKAPENGTYNVQIWSQNHALCLVQQDNDDDFIANVKNLAARLHKEDKRPILVCPNEVFANKQWVIVDHHKNGQV